MLYVKCLQKIISFPQCVRIFPMFTPIINILSVKLVSHQLRFLVMYLLKYDAAILLRDILETPHYLPPPSAWQTGFADKILLRKRQHCWDFVYIKTHFRFIPPYNSVPFDPSLYYQRWALIPWSNYVTLPYIIPSISLFQALGWIDLVIFESFKNGYIKVK